ncbi:MAG: glycine zipper 2TM domain-containing protein [Gammaproteobacteria bacterium]
MNQQLLIGGIVGALAVTAVGAFAGYKALNDGPEFAEVLDVNPVTHTIKTPRQVCSNDVVTRQKPVKDPNQIAGSVAGAVVGGVVGSQIGSGDGRKLATVGGAIAGGYAGNKVQEGMQERNTYQATETNCHTVTDSRNEVVGYDVTYRLDGEEHVVRTIGKPGSRIPVVNGQLALAGI